MADSHSGNQAADAFVQLTTTGLIPATHVHTSTESVLKLDAPRFVASNVEQPRTNIKMNSG